MKIRILTIGSRGDVQPYVALAQGLQAVGYDVGIATFEGFREFVTSHGIQFFSVTPLADSLTSSQSWQEWQASSGQNVFSNVRYMLQIHHAMYAALEKIYVDQWAACQDADAIISSMGGMAGPHIAQALGIPHMWALIYPMSRTRAFPNVFVSNDFNVNPYINLLTHWGGERIIWHLFRRPMNRFRSQTLGLPEQFIARPPALVGPVDCPIIYAYSPIIVPKPADWGSMVHVTGFWFLQETEQWTAPQGTLDFIEANRDVIYFGWGGMRLTNARRFLDMMIEALDGLGLSALLMAATDSIQQEDLPSTIHKIGAFPHEKLFGRMAGVMHHAGPGTAAAAMHASVPSVCIPSNVDQPFWAQRLAQLGVAPPPTSEKKATVEGLKRSIGMTLESAMQKRAQDIGEQMRNEDGVANGVEIITQYLTRSGTNAASICLGSKQR